MSLKSSHLIESENKVMSVYSLEAEFTRPLWTFGVNSYEFVQSSKLLIACSYRQHGKSYLGIVDVEGSKLTVIDFPCTDINNIVTFKISSLFFSYGFK
ncbi:hypothetical protein VIGAN_05217500 [Vigna angularis var. angularis]|uniref:F-box associated domain-containing protein n=1 Tax=Vigna angularis var. angularis TaxID=157739 RepID=A0A0S3S711_PHAAN|nr:hypothetical protein VIGAN_05217500 [Vigna angularis var. angularis]